MTGPILTEIEKKLFSTHWYSWLNPKPTLNDVLLGCGDHEAEGSGAWWTFVPTDIQEIWTELPVLTRVVAFRVAAEGNECCRELTLRQ